MSDGWTDPYQAALFEPSESSGPSESNELNMSIK